MTETIESFVAKLQAEGVEVGQEAARKIEAEARSKAEQIVAQAKTESERALGRARAEAEAMKNRAQTEIDLAARDVVLRLRDVLSRSLEQVLSRGAQAALGDVEFVKSVLHEVILQYARADSEGKVDVEIKVSPELQQKLAEWAMHEMSSGGGEGKQVSIDLKGTLSGAGFEYAVSGATVEMTLESVVEVLSRLVAPDLRGIVERALEARKS